MKVSTPFPFALVAILCPGAAHAELPEAARLMIEAAQATGDPVQVDAVHAAAVAAFPGGAAEIAAYESQWQDRLDKRREEEALRQESAIRSAGLFERWGGKGELGGFHSTGNNNNAGFTAALALERRGIEWRQKLIVRADYKRTNGRTSREKFLFAYEPNYDFTEQSFIYGLAQVERDKVQGYWSRYSVSGGLGYRVFDREDLSLSLKGGPAWRLIDYVEDQDESYLAGLAALDFDWHFARNLSLEQIASAFVQSANSTFVSQTGLKAGIGGGLSASLSYRVEHDTAPPDDSADTDTISRVSLIYDF